MLYPFPSFTYFAHVAPLLKTYRNENESLSQVTSSPQYIKLQINPQVPSQVATRPHSNVTDDLLDDLLDDQTFTSNILNESHNITNAFIICKY